MEKEAITQSSKHRVLHGINPRKTTLRNIIVKLTKIKGKYKILKATRKKEHLTYKGIPMRLSADFSSRTLQTKRGWHDIFKVMKGKNL